MALKPCHECNASISTEAAACPSCGAPVRLATPAAAVAATSPRAGPGTWLVIILVLLVAIAATFSGAGRDERASTAPRPALTLKDEMLVKLTPELGEFRTLVVSGTIKNIAAVTVRDPAIRCNVAGNSGTDLAELRKVIFERIEPGKTLTLNEFKVGYLPEQASAGRCTLESIQPL